MKIKFNFWTLMIPALLIFSECKKPATTTPAARTSTPTSTASTTNNVASAQACLIGTWYLDSSCYFQNGVSNQSMKTVPTATAQPIYTLVSTPYGAASQPEMQESSGTVGNAQTAGFWYVSDIYYALTGRLFLESTNGVMSEYILALTAHSLVVSGSYGAVMQNQVYFFHK